mmetsp:Transcript_11198/g.39715  ORF Transcript_11198/g.39715 Transcript_11198/m.39715 type:complete len:204 (+) Transcript_11198:603-1214(+)
MFLLEFLTLLLLVIPLVLEQLQLLPQLAVLAEAVLRIERRLQLAYHLHLHIINLGYRLDGTGQTNILCSDASLQDYFHGLFDIVGVCHHAVSFMLQKDPQAVVGAGRAVRHETPFREENRKHKVCLGGMMDIRSSQGIPNLITHDRQETMQTANDTGLVTGLKEIANAEPLEVVKVFEPLPHSLVVSGAGLALHAALHIDHLL